MEYDRGFEEFVDTHQAKDRAEQLIPQLSQHLDKDRDWETEIGVEVSMTFYAESSTEEE